MRRCDRTIRHVSMQYSASSNFETLTFARLLKGLKSSIPFIQFLFTACFNESRPSEKTFPSIYECNCNSDQLINELLLIICSYSIATLTFGSSEVWCKGWLMNAAQAGNTMNPGQARKAKLWMEKKMSVRRILTHLTPLKILPCLIVEGWC